MLVGHETFQVKIIEKLFSTHYSAIKYHNSRQLKLMYCSPTIVPRRGISIEIRVIRHCFISDLFIWSLYGEPSFNSNTPFSNLYNLGVFELLDCCPQLCASDKLSSVKAQSVVGKTHRRRRHVYAIFRAYCAFYCQKTILSFLFILRWKLTNKTDE